MDTCTIYTIIQGFMLIGSVINVVTTTTESPESLSTPPPMPSWIKCMRAGNITLLQGTSVALTSRHWCSNAEVILSCMEEEIPKTSESNPLDYFASLSYSPVEIKRRSEKLCSLMPAMEEDYVCAVNASHTALRGCSIIFKQAVDYIYLSARKMSDVTDDIIKNMSCDITRETSHCMAEALTSCDEKTRLFLMGYYGLFTSTECVYNSSIPVKHERIPSPVEPSVLQQCAMEAFYSESNSPPVLRFNISQAVIVTILKEDCSFYRKRFLCYERELPKATTFLDIWQRQTFDLQKTLDANFRFCSTINEFTTHLDAVCFNTLKSDLQVCEGKFNSRSTAARIQWTNNENSVNLQQKACAASLEKVECLKQAFKSCGDYVSEEYSRVQLEMLPDKCFAGDKSPTFEPEHTATAAVASPTAPPNTETPEAKEQYNGDENSSAKHNLSFSIICICVLIVLSVR